MRRLVAFGCSYTYGHSLEDCFQPPNLAGPLPSKMAWPNTLASHLGIETVVNNGVCGASNKKIWKSVMDFEFEPEDFVIINWSFIARNIFFDENPHNDKIILPAYKEYQWYYENLYSEYNSILDLCLLADHCHRYLWSKSIVNYHALLSIINLDHKINEVCKWKSFDFLKPDFDRIRLKYPFALDNSHPNKDAHDEYALELYKTLGFAK